MQMRHPGISGATTQANGVALCNALPNVDHGSILSKMNIPSVGAIIVLHYDNIGVFNAVILIGMVRFNKYHTTRARGGDS
jgi:hypothetical protein